MVKSFEFKDHSTKLDIAGSIFEVDITDTEVLDRIMKFAHDAQELNKEMSERPDEANFIDQLKESMQFLQNAIDEILGEGACNTIFEDRTVSFFDLLDVLEYIKNVFIESRKEKFTPYGTERLKR